MYIVKLFLGDQKLPTLFWTGNISFPLKMMVNMGSMIAWITGNARDTNTMKERMMDGYNGKYTDYAYQYDELSSFHYEKISKLLIQQTDCRNKEVADVGCGTGILSFIALEQGVSKLSCIDISKSMLDKCREKSIAKGYNDIISFYEADAEQLPFPDNSFDIIYSNMVLGMIPNQMATIEELTRIIRPGGTIAISVHGPDHYKEAIEAGLKSLKIRYYFSHRLEYWPRDEKKIKTFFTDAGLDKIRTERLTWIDKFENGGQVFDFFSASTGLWWYHRLPSELRNKEAEKTRIYFQHKTINQITSDVVFAVGYKPIDLL